MASKPTIYHEKQVKELCALHALNNLFQARGTFTKSDLDTICSRLSPNVWINPHRSMLGLGNYDINVIMAALQNKGCEAVWFDKRKFSKDNKFTVYILLVAALLLARLREEDLCKALCTMGYFMPRGQWKKVRDPGCLDLSNICGFILNVPSDYKLGFVMLPLRRRHWITIRQIQGNFYNLDSKLEAPSLIGRNTDLIAYLKEQMESKEKELFVVVSKEVEEKQLWMNQFTNGTQNHQPAAPNLCDSPESVSSNDAYESNRHVDCVKVSEVRNCLQAVNDL